MSTPESAVVHPLVLLGILDHAKRAALAPGRRVVGVLLGATVGRSVHVTSSFAVPFEEVAGESTVWYVDADYCEQMTELTKKVNASERPVGWYHSGPRLRASDLAINDVFRRGPPGGAAPLLAVVDVSAALGPEAAEPTRTENVVRTYVAVEEIGEDGSTVGRTWAHVPCAIEADEPEEVGVEHLLRGDELAAAARADTGYADGPRGSAAVRMGDALSAFDRQLAEVETYLAAVSSGQLPASHAVLSRVQDVFNVLHARPDASDAAHASSEAEAARMLASATNERLVSVLVGSLARAAIALHNLHRNRSEASADASSA